MPEPVVARIRAFLVENPWWGFIGVLLAFLAIPLEIYFHFDKEVPNLRFYVHPVRAQIVKAGVNPDLSILYNNQRISDDVTSVSIAVWNAGNKPISASDILAPIKIAIAPGHGILDAKLVSTTRGVVGLQLDKSKLSDGIVGVQFRILERNDGGVVQLLYVGDSSVQIAMQGAIIGQSSLSQTTYGRTLQSEPDQVRAGKRDVLYLEVLATILFIVWATFAIWKKKSQLYILVYALSTAALALYLWYRDVSPTPPFDFG